MRKSRLISCAELYFVTGDGQKHELPLEFFPGVYHDRIVSAIREQVPEIQVVEKQNDAA